MAASRREPWPSVLSLVVLACLAALSEGQAVGQPGQPGQSVGLLCFKCNEREVGTDVCRNSTEEDCGVVFPQQQAVCLKTVQRFSSGQPSWVFAQCQIRAAFTTEQIDQCQISNTQGTNNKTDRLETCTCTVDLCNEGPRLRSDFSWSLSTAAALFLAQLILSQI